MFFSFYFDVATSFQFQQKENFIENFRDEKKTLRVRAPWCEKEQIWLTSIYFNSFFNFHWIQFEVWLKKGETKKKIKHIQKQGEKKQENISFSSSTLFLMTRRILLPIRGRRPLVSGVLMKTDVLKLKFSSKKERRIFRRSRKWRKTNVSLASSISRVRRVSILPMIRMTGEIVLLLSRNECWSVVVHCWTWIRRVRLVQRRAGNKRRRVRQNIRNEFRQWSVRYRNFDLTRRTFFFDWRQNYRNLRTRKRNQIFIRRKNLSSFVLSYDGFFFFFFIDENFCFYRSFIFVLPLFQGRDDWRLLTVRNEFNFFFFDGIWRCERQSLIDINWRKKQKLKCPRSWEFSMRCFVRFQRCVGLMFSSVTRGEMKIDRRSAIRCESNECFRKLAIVGKFWGFSHVIKSVLNGRSSVEKKLESLTNFCWMNRRPSFVFRLEILSVE